MIPIRCAGEDEMLLSFLQGELHSDRFRSDLAEALRKCGVSMDVIENGDLSDEAQNAERRRVMGEYRGYPDREIFDNYPKNIRWMYVQFEEADLDSFRYIDYCYWNELSGSTSRPAAAAAAILQGKTVYDVPNANFLNAKAALESGAVFAPMILLQGEDGRCLILQGHVRATAYALCPGKLAGQYGYVGYCSKADLMKKNPRMYRD